MKNKMVTVIGVGSVTGRGIIMQDIVDKDAVRNFVMNDILTQGVHTIGAYKSENGRIYLEESNVVQADDMDDDTLRAVYPYEECFYQSEVLGYTQVGQNLYSGLLGLLEKLKVNGGFTCKVDNGELYMMLTSRNNSRLIAGRKQYEKAE